MRLKIEFDCDNAAFGETYDTQNAEMIQVLNQVIRCIDQNCITWNVPMFLRDSNGNRIGQFTLHHMVEEKS